MTQPDFSGLNSCVHCGFCLQSCPTFLTTGDEADSPRGRIVLMRRLALEGAAGADAALQLHLDRCLGCRGCEPVCPSGVRYGSALEAARDLLAEARGVPLAARLVLATMATRDLRRPVLAFARWLRPLARRLAGRSRLGFAMGMLGVTEHQWMNGFDQRAPDVSPPSKPPSASPLPGGDVAVFRGCIMEGLFTHVHAATERTLRANGYRAVKVRGQNCCGALHAHAGLRDGARALARQNVRAFSAFPQALVAVNSAGCGALIKEYAHLLADDPLAAEAQALATRTLDVSEILGTSGLRQGAELRLRVAYDAPCHLIHAQGVTRQPISVLEAIPGLSLVNHSEAEVCCGSAGIYSLLEPAMSQAVLSRKTQAIIQAGPDVVATGNPGCAMQIGAGLRAQRSRIAVVHPVELLDRSYRLAGWYPSAWDRDAGT